MAMMSTLTCQPKRLSQTQREYKYKRSLTENPTCTPTKVTVQVGLKHDLRDMM